MKFNCGPTTEQRMAARHEYLTQWHPWFAWRPIRIGPTQCVWLETIQRKLRPNMSYGGPIWDREYRIDPLKEIFDETKRADKD